MIRSPEPELFTTRLAKEEVAEIEAAGVVPELPLTSSVANGLEVLIPILPLEKAVNEVVPPGMRETLPVVAEPSCKVCAFVVPITPVAVWNEAPVVPAEKEAIGVPPALLRNANFALDVEVPPNNTS